MPCLFAGECRRVPWWVVTPPDEGLFSIKPYASFPPERPAPLQIHAAPRTTRQSHRPWRLTGAVRTRETPSRGTVRGRSLRPWSCACCRGRPSLSCQGRRRRTCRARRSRCRRRPASSRSARCQTRWQTAVQRPQLSSGRGASHSRGTVPASCRWRRTVVPEAPRGRERRRPRVCIIRSNTAHAGWSALV